MITIQVKVVLPSDEIRELALPLNSDIDQLYARLVTHGALPTITGRGEPIAYGFYHRRSSTYLPAHVSLTDAGVRNGDIVDVTPWPTAAPPARAQRQTADALQRTIPKRRLLILALAIVLIVSAVGGMSLVLTDRDGDDSNTSTAALTMTTTATTTAATSATMTCTPTRARVTATPYPSSPSTRPPTADTFH